jgi:hypothetical protein
MTPRVRQYALEAAERHGVLVEHIIASRPYPHKRGLPHSARYDARLELIHRLCADGFSRGQIARWLNCTKAAVRYWTRRAG